MLRPLRLPCISTAKLLRHFAKRRERLDEYEHYERPLSAKAWKRLREEESFLEYRFEDMTPGEVSQNVFIASKMDVENETFWKRASLAMGDVASAMTARQLTQACWAFGASSWHDEALVKALSNPVVKIAPRMKASHIATAAQAFARMKVRHVPVLQALSESAQVALNTGRLNGKGLSMIMKAFAELEFFCPRLMALMETWSSAGVSGSRLDVCLDLFHSLSLFEALSPSPWPSPVPRVAVRNPVAVKELAESLALRVKDLEAPQLHTAVLAMGKLRVDDPNVIRAFQKEVLADLSSLNTTSLPPVLESFALCFQSLDGKDSKEPEIFQHEREDFLLQITRRLARELRLLRPQEASRLLQAIDHLGLVDPNLLAVAAEMVPERLAAWTVEELVALIEAYAAAENRDAFMVPCLRQALVPLPEAMKRPPEIDGLQMVRAAEAFSSLRHPPGIVTLMSLWTPWTLAGATASCQLAMASLAQNHWREDTWNDAMKKVVDRAAKNAEKFPDGSEMMKALSEALAQHEKWLDASDPDSYPADDILLAILGFPKHVSKSFWCESLSKKISQASLVLLPGLLLRLSSELEITSPDRRHKQEIFHPAAVAFSEAEALRKLQSSAEKELLRRLAQGRGRSRAKEVERAPVMAVVATFKALAKIHGRRLAKDWEIDKGGMVTVVMVVLGKVRQVWHDACSRSFENILVGWGV